MFPLLLIFTFFSTLAGGSPLLEVFFFDVGYGDSILIRLPEGRHVLIDGGYPEYGARVVDEIKKLGITHLNLVVSTHPHPDHIGGLAEVLNHFKVDRVFGSHPLTSDLLPEAFVSAIKNKNIPYKPGRRGEKLFESEELSMEIFHPVQVDEDLNNSSIGIRLKFKNISFLFTADISPRAEKELLLAGVPLQANVLKAGHHGHATLREFIEAVRPDLVVISVGENPYGAPLPETLELYQQLGIKILRTDQMGTIRLATDGLTLWNLTNSNKKP